MTDRRPELHWWLGGCRVGGRRRQAGQDGGQGEAGVGKTRLVAELTARCAAEGTRVLAGGCGPVERVELARLDQVQTGAQLVGILEASPTGELVDAVFARSEGNPYFTEELLGVIRSGSSELPATLGDLLRGRLAGLPDPASRVLAAVAVAGRPVPHRLLAAATGMDEEVLLAGLRTAVERWLLVVLPDADDYEVRHALLREVVAADLLPGERARLHARLAEALAGRSDLAAASPAAGLGLTQREAGVLALVVTAAYRSAPIGCGPTCTRDVPLAGAAACRPADLGWQGRPPPAAPDKRAPPGRSPW